MRPEVRVDATEGAARALTVTTPRGSFTTPCFMPVGTRGSVRLVDSTDLGRVGAQVVLGNTYHLMLRPGAARIEGLGGLGAFAAWPGHTLTDSGGFQVFSLKPKLDDEGVTFRSTYDGDEVRLTPESAVAVQRQLGADIQMVLDVCPALPSSPEVLRRAVDITAAWAARARAAFLADDAPSQAQFGIVQGGIDAALRRESAERTCALDFDGYAIGGLSVGETQAAMVDTLGVTVPSLPSTQLRYLMGVGDPVGFVHAVAAGIDLMDCVLPTRLARHGTALTWQGRLNLKGAQFAVDDRPIDPELTDQTLVPWSRGYVRHLLLVDPPTGGRLLTLHNLVWMLGLAEQARAAVLTGTLDRLVERVASAWVASAA